jgi:mannose-1-phosphate guanylyltransferase
MTSAMVLCAGLGTRLGPLSAELPKPLMPVGDGPVVDQVLPCLRRAGIERIVVNAHHLADRVESWARASASDVTVVREPRVLGTAGGVANARAELGEGEVVVWNGDILAPEIDIALLLSELRGSGRAAVWAVAPRPSGAGTVGVDRAGRIVRLRGQRFGVEETGGDFIGIQAVGTELRDVLPASGCMVADVALPLLARGGEIGAYVHAGAWEDIGDPAALLLANTRWLERRGQSSYVAPDAHVAEGVELSRSLVGAGAAVLGPGTLERCVVFPGARATAPLTGAIVGQRTRVSVAPPV